MTGVDGMLYRVKEDEDDHLLEKYFGEILPIGDDREKITVKKGGGVRDFQSK